jgi:hypothetical protein
VNNEIDVYQEFTASTLLNNGAFSSTDRLVIKYYGTLLNGTSSTYKFQFGGASPVRTLLPVPVSVIPSDLASDILLSTVAFNGKLSAADTNVQLALNTLDDHVHSATEITSGTLSDSRLSANVLLTSSTLDCGTY